MADCISLKVDPPSKISIFSSNSGGEDQLKSGLFAWN